MITDPPKEINKSFGFRTNKSMKNQNKWDQAQRIAGKNTKKSSLICFILGLVFILVELYALVKGKVDTLFTTVFIIDAFIFIFILILIVIVTNQEVKKYN